MDRSYQNTEYEENPNYCYYHRPFFFPFVMMIFIFIALFFIFRPMSIFRSTWIFWMLAIFLPLWIVIASTGRERRRYRRYRKYYTQNIPLNENFTPTSTINDHHINTIAFCSNCGSKTDVNDRFCSKCGSKLE